jgi:ubiquinone/menaquinone biosynthesis C-methylase UbiE
LVSDTGTRRPQPHQFLYVERQVLQLPDFACAPGLILDVGGGGEGVIGRLKGEQVVSIDTIERELAEVCNDSLKIVMDARRLQFLPGSFATVTAFFSLMYMAAEDQMAVLHEVYRVLRPGGDLLLWDTAMPVPPDPEQTYLMLPLTVCLPDGQTIRTGYGAPLKPQGPAYFCDLAVRAGFALVECTAGEYLLHLRLRRTTC